MYKYNIFINDWHRSLSYLFAKFINMMIVFVNIDNKCIANDIINLSLSYSLRKKMSSLRVNVMP